MGKLPDLASFLCVFEGLNKTNSIGGGCCQFFAITRLLLDTIDLGMAELQSGFADIDFIMMPQSGRKDYQPVDRSEPLKQLYPH